MRTAAGRPVLATTDFLVLLSSWRLPIRPLLLIEMTDGAEPAAGELQKHYCTSQNRHLRGKNRLHWHSHSLVTNA